MMKSAAVAQIPGRWRLLGFEEKGVSQRLLAFTITATRSLGEGVEAGG